MHELRLLVWGSAVVVAVVLVAIAWAAVLVLRRSSKGWLRAICWGVLGAAFLLSGFAVTFVTQAWGPQGILVVPGHAARWGPAVVAAIVTAALFLGLGRRGVKEA